MGISKLLLFKVMMRRGIEYSKQTKLMRERVREVEERENMIVRENGDGMRDEGTEGSK